MNNNSRVYSSKEERIFVEKRNAELVNLVLDFVIENGMSEQEMDTCIAKVREAFYSDGVISRESNEKTAQEVRVQEQLSVTYDYGILETSRFFITTDSSFYERMKKNPKFIAMFNPDFLLEPMSKEDISSKSDFNFYCFRILEEE